MRAAPSTRALDHVTLSFGSTIIPVSVFTGTVSDQGIQRKQFTSVPVMEGEGENAKQVTETITKDDGTTEEVPVFEDHPVGSQNFDKITGEVLPYSAVQRKIDTEYGYVYVEDHEIETLLDLTPKSIVIKTFQPQALFHQGHYVPKGLAYIEPSKVTQGKKKLDNPLAQKVFVALLKGMREEGVMALVEFTSRGVPKPGVLMPDGTMWLVHHTDALREQRPLPDVEVGDAVVAKLRGMIVEHGITTDVQDLTDRRSELIQAFADEKAQAGDFGRSAESEEVRPQEVSDDDLLAMLSASVEAAKQAG